ncbi:MAG TPA: hypothetical protein PLU10_10375, partial [Chitinophagaceae bacterium]|nr:hypothetical protein [Chitinophagaceae bacterium]
MMKINTLTRIIFMVGLLFANHSFSQCPPYHVIYVDSSIAVSGDGSSWSTAFKTLKQALDTASICTSIDSIHVAKGSYYPTGNQNATDRNQSFSMRNNLAILGGYPSGGGVRSPLVNITKLSGNINSSVADDNSYHVLYNLNLDQTAVLDGVTITNGYASDAGFSNPGPIKNLGGGMYSENSSCTFVNCKFTDNGAFLQGGGVYAIGGHMHFDQCSWVEQFAQYGGGMYLINAEATLAYPIFDGNSAIENGLLGGGIMMDSSKAVIHHANFSYNGAPMKGGAIYAKHLSELNIDSSVFTQNSTNSLSLEQSNLKLTNSSLADQGVVASGVTMNVQNCQFQNYARLSIQSDSARIINCQFDHSGIDVSANSLIENCEILNSNNPGIEVWGGNAQIIHTKVSQCNNNGLYLHAP